MSYASLFVKAVAVFILMATIATIGPAGIAVLMILVGVLAFILAASNSQ